MRASGATSRDQRPELLTAELAARILGAFGQVEGTACHAVLDAGQRFLAGTPGLVADTGARTHPLEAEGTTVGFLISRDDAPPATTAALRTVLETMAQRLAEVRVVNGDEVERLRETNLFYLLGETIGASMEPDRIARALIAQALRVARADAAAMLVFDPTARTAELVVATGDPPRSHALAEAARRQVTDLAGGADLEPIDEGPLMTIHVTGRQLQLGTLLLCRSPGAEPFSARDEQCVRALTSGAGLERARYHQRELQRLRQEEELAMGRRIQLGLLPRNLPRPEGWQLSVAYEAAREVGGDFYDAVELDAPPRRLSLVVGDVTGKGVPAALMMAHARSVIRAAAAGGDDPATVLKRANQLILADGRSGLFLTALVATLDLDTGHIALASAGHEPAMVISPSGAIAELGGGGTLLGLTPHARIETSSTTIAVGAALVAYTDGVTEARNSAGAFLGEDALRRAAGDAAGGTAAEIAAAITAAAAAWRAEADPFDDLTLVVVRRSVGGR
jgi:serine phosphatase RsbU (regulator of sigma subunit)